MGVRSPRAVAVEILQNVDARDAYAGIALDSLLHRNDFDRRDRAFITELVYGTLRNLSLLDWIIESVSTRKLERIDNRTLAIIRSGLYQALFVAAVPPEVAGNESVNVAKAMGRRSSSGFVNAVLRGALRKWRQNDVVLPDPESDPVGYIFVMYSHPHWLVERWIARFGFERTRKLCESDNHPAPLTLRTNSLKITRADLMERLRNSGAECVPTGMAPEGIVLLPGSPPGELREFSEGLCIVQDQAAMLVSRILSPYPGCSALDVCSAPGGKTTHIAELMKDQGRVLAIDRNEARLSLVRENCSRLGISIVETQKGDAAALPAGLSGMFDRVLVDAPCTGLGVLRRKPDIRWRRNQSDLDSLRANQRAILSSAGKCLKKGGLMVYSTCSFEPEETGDVIEWFLENHSNFRLIDPTGPARGHIIDSGIRSIPLEYARSGIPFLEAGSLPSDSRDPGGGGQCIVLLPDLHGTDGFFMAVLERTY